MIRRFMFAKIIKYNYFFARFLVVFNSKNYLLDFRPTAIFGNVNKILIRFKNVIFVTITAVHIFKVVFVSLLEP